MKKKYVLKKWVKVALTILGVAALMLMFYLAFRITPEEVDMINACMDHGGTLEQCKKGVLGVY